MTDNTEQNTTHRLLISPIILLLAIDVHWMRLHDTCTLNKRVLDIVSHAWVMLFQYLYAKTHVRTSRRSKFSVFSYLL